MLCPTCGTEAPDDLPECINCGQVFLQAVPEGEVLPDEIEPEPLLREIAPEPEETLEGLERTRFEQVLPSGIEPLPGLESTAIADDGFPQPDEPLPDIEPTQVRSPAGATPTWEGTLPGFDPGRESDDGLRTPAAGDVSVCVHCGAQATGMFCEACGHRRTASERPAPPEQAANRADAEAVLCPACFARRPPYRDEVRGIDRCGECGLPLPATEGL